MVIAIIAILAGLLLPTLGKAKARGQAVSCLNNVRQIGLSTTMFSDDNDGKFPGSDALSGNLTAFLRDLPGEGFFFPTGLVSNVGLCDRTRLRET